MREIMKALAFLGRYAHQPAAAVLRMSVTEMQMLMEETGNLLRDEEESLARRLNT